MNKEKLEKLAGGKADLLKVFMQYRNGEISKEYVDNYIDAALVCVPVYTPTIKQLNEENDNGEV